MTRQLAAGVLCAGLGLLALDWLVIGGLYRGFILLRQLHQDRVISLAGIVLAIAGGYRLLTLSPDRRL